MIPQPLPPPAPTSALKTLRARGRPGKDLNLGPGREEGSGAWGHGPANATPRDAALALSRFAALAEPGGPSLAGTGSPGVEAARAGWEAPADLAELLEAEAAAELPLWRCYPFFLMPDDSDDRRQPGLAEARASGRHG
jgi:hypothetical protein